ncbi:DNA repair and recombination protein RadA, partial [Candidatus Bathyarchaeota archaeon]|nr:DNA repair and recombination protein RadA [Candidatus Bathyarchaeota archaeon]
MRKKQMSGQMDITDIKGVGAATATKLKEAGFTTVEALAVTPIRELVENAGVGEDTAAQIQQRAREILGLDFMTAMELFEKRSKAKRITTGSKNIDKLLGGGVETQAMTEFVGEFGAGKSQISMQLCVTSQQPNEQGGLGGKVLFIDTEGTFSPERIHNIATAKGFDANKVLENIIYARCYNSDHQMLIVDKSFKIVEEEGVKLVVVDSLISHFRGEYVGRESLAERQQKLNRHIHKLLRLAEIYNLAVVITNQIQSNPQAFFGDPNHPAGGNILAHASTHRLYIRKGKANTRVIRI